MVSDAHIKIIQQSFGVVADESTAISRMFYNRLFELDPSVQSLFTNDMTMQRGKFFQMLALIIGTLHEPDNLKELLESLALRHREYGVQPANYTTVGEALIWAFEHALQEHFTPELRTAWEAVYAHIAKHTAQAS